MGRGIALLFHDRSTRWGEWSVAYTGSTLTSGENLVTILQAAGWAPGLVLTGGKSRPHRDSIPDRPARSQSLYRLSYLAHLSIILKMRNVSEKFVEKIRTNILCSVPFSKIMPFMRCGKIY